MYQTDLFRPIDLSTSPTASVLGGTLIPQSQRFCWTIAAHQRRIVRKAEITPAIHFRTLCRLLSCRRGQRSSHSASLSLPEKNIWRNVQNILSWR